MVNIFFYIPFKSVLYICMDVAFMLAVMYFFSFISHTNVTLPANGFSTKIFDCSTSDFSFGPEISCPPW